MTAKTAITRMITSAFALLLYSNATLAAGEITAQRLIEADKEQKDCISVSSASQCLLSYPQIFWY